jgi:hypothetical protein
MFIKSMVSKKQKQNRAPLHRHHCLHTGCHDQAEQLFHKRDTDEDSSSQHTGVCTGWADTHGTGTAPWHPVDPATNEVSFFVRMRAYSNATRSAESRLE